MRMQVRTLQNNFGDIATRVSDQIQENNIDAENFRRRFMLKIGVSQRHKYQQFLECFLMKLEPGTTTDDLLCRLSMYWDFLNYGLLEHTVNIFGDAALKQDMEDYIDELRTFRVNTKLCDFIDNWPVQGQDPPTADFEHFVVKMKKNWEECTLEDIENFKGTLTHKFFLPDFMLLLREAKKGCICLTWYTPAPIAIVLVKNLPSYIETKFLKSHAIQRISVKTQKQRFFSHRPDFEQTYHTGSAGRQHHTSNTRFKYFLEILSVVLLLIPTMVSASEAHKTVMDTRARVSVSTVFDKTSCEEMCRATYWMSLSFTSTFLSLEWLIFGSTKNGTPLWVQLLASICVFLGAIILIIKVCICRGPWVFEMCVSVYMEMYMSSLTPFVLLIETEMYFIIFKTFL